MRARLVGCVAVWLALGGDGAWSEEVAVPESEQVASCPTVLPVAEGERSIVVPTVAPHVEAPHVASRPLSTEHEAAKSLLKEKLAERDRLQREIAALREATQTPEQMLVRVKMLEIDLTKLRRLGVDLTTLVNGQAQNVDVAAFVESGTFTISGTPQAAKHDAANVDRGMLDLFEALEQRNVAKVLAEPSMVVTTGRPASLCVGGEFPVPVENLHSAKFRKYGTQLDLVAESLGDNRVRIDVRPRVSELDSSRAIKVGDVDVPALTVRECDLSREMTLGQTAVVAGLVQERQVSVMTESGARTEVQEVALVVVVTPEIVR